jgi:acylglycerol lipase
MKGTGIRLAQAGYAVFGLDVEGHGKSDGLQAYIPSFNNIVDDTISYFKSVREREEYKNKARFLYGESMGGAVVLYIHWKEPQEWNGAILIAPMCKIAEKVKPPPLVVAILIKLANIIPTWKIVPTKDIIANAIKDPVKRKEILKNPYLYRGKPRVKTALELLNASIALEKRLDQVTIPFLLLQGEADIITDPEISKELYESAKSPDKEIKLYPGMWHSLTLGESDEDINLVFNDILQWLDKRSSAGSIQGGGSPSVHEDVSPVVTDSSGAAAKHENISFQA